MNLKTIRLLVFALLALGGAGLLFASGGSFAAADGDEAMDAPLATEAPGRAMVMDIQGAIGPATSDFLSTGLEKARLERAEILIIRLDTPGGLVTSTRDMIREILASPVPVAIYVAPSGAQAASAGTFLLYASHLAAMAPGTNVGAATPVQMGGPMPGGDERERSPRRDRGGSGDPENGEREAAENGDEAEESRPARSGDDGDAAMRKATSDAAAMIRSLAELHGRNAEWAEKAVREADSITYSEALELGVIEIVANSVEDLLAQADGRTVKVSGVERTLSTDGLVIEEIEPSWKVRVLSVITNPNVAFLLMMIGVYGLIFEFTNPGAMVPGVIGAISLVLGLYALNVLPVNYAGLALVVLGIAFMVAEAFLPSFGILGLGGLAAFAVGATILFDADHPDFQLSMPVIAGTTAVSGALLILVLAYVVRSHQRPVTTGEEALTQERAEVISWSDGRGRIFMHGEEWTARGVGEFQPGQKVAVTGRDGLTVFVAPEQETSNHGEAKKP